MTRILSSGTVLGIAALAGAIFYFSLPTANAQPVANVGPPDATFVNQAGNVFLTDSEIMTACNYQFGPYQAQLNDARIDNATAQNGVEFGDLDYNDDGSAERADFFHVTHSKSGSTGIRITEQTIATQSTDTPGYDAVEGHSGVTQGKKTIWLWCGENIQDAIFTPPVDTFQRVLVHWQLLTCGVPDAILASVPYNYLNTDLGPVCEAYREFGNFNLAGEQQPEELLGLHDAIFGEPQRVNFCSCSNNIPNRCTGGEFASGECGSGEAVTGASEFGLGVKQGATSCKLTKIGNIWVETGDTC